MHSKKILIFDIESEYGHFRKFNTTTSPLTYSIPTRPAIAGLIGAILGIERETSMGKMKAGITPVCEVFSKQSASIAVQLLNPVKKVNIGFNLLDTEKTASSFFNVKQRTQIEFELLKNPSFRIFLALDDETIFDSLSEKLKGNQNHFSPYLGLSQFTTKVTFKGIENCKLTKSTDYQEVITAINLSNCVLENPIEFNYQSNAFKYTSDTMPVEMNISRIVSDYSEIIIETNGKTINVKSDSIYQTETFGNILFL